MKPGLAWALGVGLAVAVPVIAFGVVAQAAKQAAQTVQVQTALDSTGVAAHETNLGDLVADAVREAGGADFALVAADEIKETTIPAGSVAPGQILKALRYADDPTDTVVVLKLTGAQLLQAADRSVSRVPQPFDGFLQVSGLHLTDDAGKPARLTETGGGEIKPDAAYHVAVTKPLAEGSFGYFRIWGKDDIIADSAKPPVTIAAALGDYLAAHRTINVSVEDRITLH